MSLRVQLLLGDSQERLEGLPEVTAVITDPPYGLEFQGKDWDAPWKYTISKHGFSDGGERRPAPSFTLSRNPTCLNCGARQRTWQGGPPACECGAFESANETAADRRAFQEWAAKWLTLCRDRLGPGGVIKVFGGTRMFHRMSAAMATAGFCDLHLEAWVHGQGFPKSLNLAKAIDKSAGSDPQTEKDIQAWLRMSRETRGISKADVDRLVFGGSTRYGWVEGRGGERANETYLPTPEEWVRLKEVLGLDDRFDAYIAAAVPSRANRFRADGGKSEEVGRTEGDWGYQPDGARWGGERVLTKPRTPEAQAWEGWGTALKPSWEPFIVGRKA